ncbi:hypothetical protein [Paracoccus versutus]
MLPASWKAGWRAWVFASLLPCLASPAWAEQPDRTQAALMSGSPRLAGFALMRDRPAGRAPLLARLLHHEGMLRDARPQPVLLSRHLTARPLLRWDDNINGGIPGESLTVGGIDLTVSPESRARGGLVLGLAASAGARYRLAPGRVLRLAGQATAVYSPRHDLSRQDLGLGACLAQHLGEWRFVDLCGGYAFGRTDLSESHLAWTGLRGTRLFEAAGALHEMSLGLRQTWRKDYRQAFADLSLGSAVSGIGAVGLQLSAGERVAGHNAIRYRAGLSLTRPVGNRPVTLGIGWQREEGSAVFGTPRRDDVRTLGIEVALTPKFTLLLAGQRRSSTVPMYDENRVMLDVRWR